MIPVVGGKVKIEKKNLIVLGEYSTFTEQWYPTSASSSSSSSSQRKIHYVHWWLHFEEQVLVLYHGDGRERARQDQDPPKAGHLIVYLAWSFLNAVGSPTQICSQLFHTLAWSVQRDRKAACTLSCSSCISRVEG